VQPLANTVEILDRNGCERRGRLIEVFRALLQDRRNVFDARENLSATRFIIRCRDGERFYQRGERLLDVKIRVAFPAGINFEFPASARRTRSRSFSSNSNRSCRVFLNKLRSVATLTSGFCATWH